MTKHPQVIPGTDRIIGTCPSGPLMAWDELYPDGTVKTFKEVYTVTQGASGTMYGGTLVVDA